MQANTRIIDAVFLGGSPNVENLPHHPHPEVAIFGRSNAGKSTFINRLTNRRDLARVSKRPGRTTEINLFECRVRTPRGDMPLVVADLPGYGYAKLSKAEHRGLISLISSYLTKRAELAVACVLNDCRREADVDEFAIRDAVFENDKHFLVVLTKMDKLSKREAKESLAHRSVEYTLQESDLLLSGEGISVEPVLDRVVSLIGQGRGRR